MDELSKKIGDCDAKIAKLEAQLSELKNYRRGLVDARALSGAQGSFVNPFLPSTEKPQHKSSGRSLSQTWSRILHFIGTDTKSLDEIMEFSDVNSLGVERHNARSQLHTMVKRSGILERLSDGRVQLTAKGLAVIASPTNGEGPSASTGEPSVSTSVRRTRTRNVDPGTGGV